MNFTNATDTYDGDNADIIEYIILLIVIVIIIICCVKNGGCDDEPHNTSDRVHRAQLRRAARGQGPFVDI